MDKDLVTRKMRRMIIPPTDKEMPNTGGGTKKEIIRTW
jgi:hypothetical protein